MFEIGFVGCNYPQAMLKSLSSPKMTDHFAKDAKLGWVALVKTLG